MRVDPGDPAALVRAIEELRCSPERLAVMGRTGASYAERVLGRPAARARVLELAQNLLAARRTLKSAVR